MIPATKNNVVILDSRASCVLYQFLLSKKISKPFVLPVNICEIVLQVFNVLEIPVIFCDISLKDFCISEPKLLDIVNRFEISGILLNHTYGFKKNFNNLVDKIKSKSPVTIIEDKCLSIPSLEHNTKVDLTLYSSGYSKFIELDKGGGYGVMHYNIPLDDTKKTIKLSDAYTLQINNFDLSNKLYFNTLNEKREAIVEHKSKINAIYKHYLSRFSISEAHNMWRFNIFSKNKKMILDKLFENKLFASSHYKPLHHSREEYTNSYYVFDHIINLFNDYNYNEVKAEKTAKLILKYS